MNDSNYSRRDFIKFTSLTIGALLMVPITAVPSSASGQLSVQAEALGKKYRGTRTGLVFESTDDGQTWQQVANFGSHCAVMQLHEREGQIFADIAVADHGFVLKSADARTWRTV
jgi:hypothetical protein